MCRSLFLVRSSDGASKLVYPHCTVHSYVAYIRLCSACAAPAGYPRITDSPSLKAVEKGRGTVMICGADGSPEPVVSWLKDSVPVDMTDPRLQILPSGALRLIRASMPRGRGRLERTPL